MRRRPAQSGFSLIELVVAVALASLLLAGAWSWFFTTAAACARSNASAEAASRLAFARRLFTLEVASGSLLASPSGSCSRTCLTVSVTHIDGSSETIVYYFDAARGILWRKNASNHVVEGVQSLSFDYLSSSGVPLSLAADGTLSATTAGLVRAVRLSLTVVVHGAAPLARTGTVPLTW
ncbi:MAG: prepilin-type N-terminal cleavage/methylation domain-containing protein [Thermoleophilia bacterium]